MAWDVFRTVSRKGETFYESTTNWFEVAAKTVKVIAYIIIFLAVLLTAVVSKASLLLMTQALGNANLVSLLCLYFLKNISLFFFSLLSYLPH